MKPNSPCVGLCQLDETDRCLGCLRTLEEIVTWTALSDRQRLRIMERVSGNRSEGER